jgi:hypothetical protein
VLTTSPDGRRILLNDDRLLASDGTIVGALDPAAGFFGAVWADDNHLCQLTTSGYVASKGRRTDGSAWLQYVTLNGGRATVKKVVDLGEVADDSKTTRNFAIAACSSVKDQVIVLTRVNARTGSGDTRGSCVVESRTYRLSEGRLLADLKWSVPRIVRASADGNVVASAPCSQSARLMTWVDEPTTLASNPIPPFIGMLPDGLSSDGSLIVLRQPLSATSPLTELVRLPDRHVVYSSPAHGVNLVTGRPASGDIYLAMPARGGGYDLYLATGSHVRLVARQVFTVVCPYLG